MESSSWPLVVVFALVIGLGGAVHQMIATEEAAESLQSVQRSLESTERSVQAMKANLIARQQAADDLRKPDARSLEIEALGLRSLELEAAIEALVEQDGGLRQQIKTTIEEAQASAPGHEFHDLALTPAKIIHNAVLQKFDNDVVTIIHSDGLLKLSGAEIPGRVKDRLLIDIEEPPPLARTLQAEALAAAAKKGQRVPPTPKPPAVSRYETPEWKKYTQELKAYESRLLNARLVTQTLLDQRTAVIKQRSLNPPGSTSMSSKYYADRRKYALGVQLVEIDNRIASARREELRIRGLKPKPPISR
ncbi:MAG: hypothetical protein H7A55_09375 [Verrucomicrobiaceae bacterium]|nr:hypothetical protein [Verrucomicrobiaceae bacterium]